MSEPKFWNPASWSRWTGDPTAEWTLNTITGIALREADIGPNDRVLVVACGYGRELRRMPGRVTAVDISRDMVEAAAKIRPDATFHVAAAESLPFENDCFDKVVCVSALMHFRDDLKAVAEMQRVVRSGGRVVITYNSALSPGSFLTRPYLWMKSRRNPGYRQHFRFPGRFGGRIVKTTGSIGSGPTLLWEPDRQGHSRFRLLRAHSRDRHMKFGLGPEPVRVARFLRPLRCG